MINNAPHNALRYHVSGAIERGEGEAIVTVEADTYFDEFVAQYAHTILWQSPEDDEGNLLSDDHTADDFTADAMDEMRANCRDFLTEDTRAILNRLAESCAYDAGAAGHDFALTRNGHGAGFWDRGFGEDGDTLTSLAKPYGEQSAYEGDDGYLHVA